MVVTVCGSRNFPRRQVVDRYNATNLIFDFNAFSLWSKSESIQESCVGLWCLLRQSARRKVRLGSDGNAGPRKVIRMIIGGEEGHCDVGTLTCLPRRSFLSTLPLPHFFILFQSLLIIFFLSVCQFAYVGGRIKLTHTRTDMRKRWTCFSFKWIKTVAT